MHKSIVIAAAALLTAAGVCLAQPPGTTREMIERALPLEGAPLAEPGPYQVTSEAAFGSIMWTFKGDKKAGAMFVGKNCSLCTNSNWEVKSKGIKE